MSLRVGLLGAGRIGNVHAKAIFRHHESELVAVSDAYEANARALAAQYGASVMDTCDIISDPKIDAVLIATPTDTHADLIEKATSEGKAVLCEKPVDLSLARAQQCLDHVQKVNGQVMVGFNRRFDPNFNAMKSSLLAGDIGNADILSITSFDPAPPPLDYIKASGGIFRDMMIHDFDMANFFMGGLPQTITAKGSAIVDQAIGAVGDFDTAIVTMTYPNGAMAVIKNSRRASYGYDQRIEILGSDGLLQTQNLLENTVVKSTDAGVTSAKPTYFFLERYMAAYEAEWAQFVDALSSDTALPVTLEDGILALDMADAAHKSAHSGGTIDLRRS